MLSADVASQMRANSLWLWSAACSRSQRVVARGLYSGLSVPASTFKLTKIGAAYLYLTLLSPAEAIEALQQSLEATKAYSLGLFQELLKFPELRTQLAVAYGLPLLLHYLQQTLLHDGVRNGLTSQINTEQSRRYVMLI